MSAFPILLILAGLLISLRVHDLANKPIKYWNICRKWYVFSFSGMSISLILAGLIKLANYPEFVFYILFGISMFFTAAVPCGIKVFNKNKVLFFIRTLYFVLASAGGFSAAYAAYIGG